MPFLPRLPITRYICDLLMGIAAVAVVATSVEEVYVHICRRKAERVLHAVRQLQVGKSTFEDARAVMIHNGGTVWPHEHSDCSPAHCSFVIVLKHHSLLLPGDVDFPPRLGLQARDGGPGVEVDAGVVTSVTYEADVRGSGGWLLVYELFDINAFPKGPIGKIGRRPYSVRSTNITTEGGGGGLMTTLTSQANAEERNHAFEFNFDCLTKFGGCTSLCQLAPGTFADYVKQTGHMPRREELDPNCARFKPLAAEPDSKHP